MSQQQVRSREREVEVSKNHKEGLLSLREKHVESPHYFTPEELEKYNKFDPDFAKQYLRNVIVAPKENAKNNSRIFTLVMISIIVASVVALFLVAVVAYLISIGEYKYAITFSTGALVVLLVAMLKKKHYIK